MFVESARVARFGFTATELDRQKRDLLRLVERAFDERDKQESARLASQYVQHFLVKEPTPGIAYEYALLQRFLRQIALDDINKVGRDWTGDRSRVVMVGAPQKDGVVVPDEQRLAAVMKGATEKEITAYVDTAANETLLAALPDPGKIAKSATKDAFGITEWELSNGVKVVLKPTTFKQDEVVFRATSPGGTSLSSDQDFVAASSAFLEIETLKASGPTEKQVSDVKETLLRDFETNMKQNSYLLGQISVRYQESEELNTLFNLAERYQALNAATIQEAARAYLNTANYVRVTLYPEK